MKIEIKRCESHTPKNLFDILNIKDDVEEQDEKVVEYLRTIVEWNKVFSMIMTFKHHYNERLVRMLKSHLICKSIEVFSGRKLKYVDEIGHDFICLENDFKFEFKHGLDLFQTDRTDKTKSIKLDNTNGSSSFTKHYKKTFDYLILVDSSRCGIISYEKLEPYIRNDGDGRSVVIDKGKISFIKESINKSINQKIYVDDEVDKCLNRLILDFNNLYEKNK